MGLSATCCNSSNALRSKLPSRYWQAARSMVSRFSSLRSCSVEVCVSVRGNQADTHALVAPAEEQHLLVSTVRLLLRTSSKRPPQNPRRGRRHNPESSRSIADSKQNPSISFYWKSGCGEIPAARPESMKLSMKIRFLFTVFCRGRGGKRQSDLARSPKAAAPPWHRCPLHNGIFHGICSPVVD